MELWATETSKLIVCKSNTFVVSFNFFLEFFRVVIFHVQMMEIYMISNNFYDLNYDWNTPQALMGWLLH